MSTTVIENPAALMLAYRFAEKASPHRAHALRLNRASARWSDTPILGGHSHFAGAIECAEAAGVGALFMDGVAAVVEDQALQDAAKADPSQKPTEQDEAYLSWYLDSMKAAASQGGAALKAAYEQAMYYAPSEIAKRAVVNATQPYADAISATAESTKATMAKVYEDQKDVPVELLKTVGKQATAAAIWGVAGIMVIGGIMYAMYGPKR